MLAARRHNRLRLGLLLAILLVGVGGLQLLAARLEQQQRQAAQTALAHQRQAVRYVSSRDYQAAAEEYATALQANPAAAAQLHFDLAETQRQAGESGSAIREYAAVLVSELDDDPQQLRAAAALQLGRLHLRSGELAQSLDSYAHALAIQPDNAQFYEERGDVYLWLGQHEAALADYLAARDRYGVRLQSGGTVYLTDRIEDRLLRKLHQLGAWLASGGYNEGARAAAAAHRPCIESGCCCYLSYRRLRFLRKDQLAVLGIHLDRIALVVATLQGGEG